MWTQLGLIFVLLHVTTVSSDILKNLLGEESAVEELVEDLLGEENPVEELVEDLLGEENPVEELVEDVLCKNIICAVGLDCVLGECRHDP
uniref:Antimicrobial peptide n=1 Tax=Steinernema glaseri TaxID=37863 RepID=A0A1I7YLX3_9BILA